MSTILIVTLGGSPKPVENAIKQNQPDFVFFLCSKEHEYQKGSEGQVEEIAKNTGFKGERFDIKTINDADNLDHVFNACHEIMESIAKHFSQPNKIIANYTGGTKTMSVGLAVYTIFQKDNWDLQVNSTFRKDLIKVDRGDISTKVDLSNFYFQNLQKEIDEMESNHNYEGALDRLSWYSRSFSMDHSKQDYIRKKHTRFTMLRDWDRFEYEQALESSKELEGCKPFINTLKKCKFIQNYFEGNNDKWHPNSANGFELVEDIVDNAKRCASRKRYDDAMSRLYRATELLAQVKLARDYAINTSEIDIDNENIPEATKKWLEQKKNKNKYQTGLMDSFRLLYEMDDPLGVYWNSNKDELRAFINNRNYSFLAHGLKPITEKQWNHDGIKWCQWILSGTEILKK